MKKLFMLVTLGILLLGIVSSLDSLGTFKQNEVVRISQVCSDATYINLSSVSYPNSSKAVTNIEMTSSGNGEFYYDYNLTSVEGRYNVNGISDGCTNTFATYFEITPNGNEPPSELVAVLFILFFILIVVGLLGLVMYNVFHFIAWDFDAVDLIYNVSTYFGVFVVYILGVQYMGNTFINDFLVWVIGVGAVTNVILPLIAFIMCYIRGTIDTKGAYHG